MVCCIDSIMLLLLLLYCLISFSIISLRLQRYMSIVALELLRDESSITSAKATSCHFKNPNQADRQFQRISVQERSKFDKETGELLLFLLSSLLLSLHGRNLCFLVHCYKSHSKQVWRNGYKSTRGRD